MADPMQAIIDALNAAIATAVTKQDHFANCYYESDDRWAQGRAGQQAGTVLALDYALELVKAIQSNAPTSPFDPTLDTYYVFKKYGADDPT